MGVEDITDALKIRESVFINEQNCPPEIERDEHDKTAMHLVLYVNDAPVGCGRIVPGQDDFKLGRIAVLKPQRGKHYGDLILRLLLFKSVEMGAKQIRLGAQVSAVAFYERFGFAADGEDYMEAGIAHTPMVVKAEDVLYPSDCHH